MTLSVGIIGLPNAGKSTIFNALTKSRNAACASYPFCTIEPNKAMVPVADRRVDRVAQIVKPERRVYAAIEFIDIAGLVAGANRGEGLGNQFLAQIRECDALLHIARCFPNEDISHVCADIDPVRDVEIVNTELILSDIQILERRIGALKRKVRNEKGLDAIIDAAESILEHLDSGKLAATYPQCKDEKISAFRAELGLLTDKKTIFCANIGEGDISKSDGRADLLRNYADEHGAVFESVCGAVEMELADMQATEREEFLEIYGLRRSGLEETVKKIYSTLGLCSFITAKPKEVRAWTVELGCPASKAAGKIHTDFERGFIRANVVKFNDFDRCGSIPAAREEGVLHIEGKDYAVQDGDVIEFLFNV